MRLPTMTDVRLFRHHPNCASADFWGEFVRRLAMDHTSHESKSQTNPGRFSLILFDSCYLGPQERCKDVSERRMGELMQDLGALTKGYKPKQWKSQEMLVGIDWPADVVTVLDLGCGTGTARKALQKIVPGMKYHGDLAPLK